MAKIKNINEKYGDPIVFEGSTIEQAKIDMAQAIISCGHEISGLNIDEMLDSLQEGEDYEVLDD